MCKAWRRRAVARDTPTMERGLAQLWSWDHALHVECKLGECEPHVVANGLWQGSCEAAAVYFVGFRRALAHFLEEAAAKGVRVDLLKYIDDACLSVSPEDLEVAWPLLQPCLSSAGFRLAPEKCKAYVPGATEANPRITRLLEKRFDGLPLLGTALNGDLESFHGPFSLGVQPAGERLERAIKLLAQIRAMTHEVLESSVLQAGWCLVSSCAAHSLDFNMRVHTPGGISPLTTVLSTALTDTVMHLLGLAGALTQHTKDQLILGINEGGFGLLNFTAAAPAARLAARLQVRPVVSARLQSVGWSRFAVDAFLPCDAACRAQDSLRSMNIVLDSAGVPCRAPLAADLSELDLLTPPRFRMGSSLGFCPSFLWGLGSFSSPGGRRDGPPRSKRQTFRGARKGGNPRSQRAIFRGKRRASRASRFPSRSSVAAASSRGWVASLPQVPEGVGLSLPLYRQGPQAWRCDPYGYLGFWVFGCRGCDYLAFTDFCRGGVYCAFQELCCGGGDYFGFLAYCGCGAGEAGGRAPSLHLPVWGLLLRASGKGCWTSKRGPRTRRTPGTSTRR